MKQLIILTAVLLFTLQACSQKKDSVMIKQNPKINANNIVEELTKQVKHYPKEPIYLIGYGYSYCYFEILINDIPVKKEFKNIGGISAVEINHAIFKSGDQKVTFRLYPIGKVEGHPGNHDVFESEVEMTLKIETYDKLTGKGQTLMEYSPTVPNPKKYLGAPERIFAGVGKNYYEESFIFHAEVPYQLEGFDKAQDLRKWDQKQLEAKLVQEYERVKSIYQNKDYDNIARISYDNWRNEFVAFYNTKEDIEGLWAKLTNIYKLNSFQMQPIENYELKFFADGKLVALMSKSQEHWLRGNSALWAEFDRRNGEETLTMNRYFYMLEGENDFRVY